MKVFLAVLALVAGVPAAGLTQERSGAEFVATTVALSATGEVRAPPDLAIIELGVRAQAPGAAAAFAQARAQMAAIASTLRRQGVADADVQTAQLDLQAQYDEGQGRPRRLTGYEAANSVSVRLHDLGRVGETVDALVAAGANSVEGIRFELADPAPAEDEARRRAVKALEARAGLYAQATGYRVQRLVSLSEGGGGYAGQPRPVFAMRRLAVSTPVAAGELTVSVNVNALYELAR